MSNEIKHSIIKWRSVCHVCGAAKEQCNRFDPVHGKVDRGMYVRICDDCLEGMVRVTLLKKIGVK